MVGRRLELKQMSKEGRGRISGDIWYAFQGQMSFLPGELHCTPLRVMASLDKTAMPLRCPTFVP